MEDEQQKLRDMANDDADGFLYHYTSLEALNGIITNKTLWASHIKYLNDTSEQKIVRDLVFDRIMLGATTNTKHLIEQMNRLFARDDGTFVVCFSEDGGDRLSQWRAYGGNSGVCLKFNKDALLNYCHKGEKIQAVSLQKIHYVLPEGDDYVNALADRLLDDIDRVISSGTITPVKVAHEGAFFKHKAFREEKEWRMLVVKLDQDLKHRVRGSLLVPYIELDLNDGLADLLEAVIVGPINHKEQTAEAIQELLRDKGLKSVVGYSNTPYRGF